MQRIQTVDAPVYRDRQHAGAALAWWLRGYAGGAALVLGVARGGVVVAAEVARRLRAPLDVIAVRKIGAPHAPELGIGAVTADGATYVLPAIRHAPGFTLEYPGRATVHAIELAQQLERRLRGDRPPLALGGRHVILVDDGLVMGTTARAAIRSVRRHGPSQIVVAVPVGASEACAAVRAEVDAVVCPLEISRLAGIGQAYEEFEPVEERDLIPLLTGHAERSLVA